MSAATVSRSELAQKARAFPTATFRILGIGLTGLGVLVVIWGAL